MSNTVKRRTPLSILLRCRYSKASWIMPSMAYMSIYHWSLTRVIFVSLMPRSIRYCLTLNSNLVKNCYNYSLMNQFKLINNLKSIIKCLLTLQEDKSLLNKTINWTKKVWRLLRYKQIINKNNNKLCYLNHFMSSWSKTLQTFLPSKFSIFTKSTL